MRLAEPSAADDLATEQPARAALGDQLDPDGFGAGVVAGARRRIHDDADHGEAGVLRLVQ